MRKTAVAVAATLVSVNIWTGAPLLALWVGSRLVPASGLSMSAVFVVVLVLAVEELALTFALAWLNIACDGSQDGRRNPRRTPAWLRSMRGEREQTRRERARSTPVERIVMLSVVAAVLTFEVWFFFFAHYHFQGY